MKALVRSVHSADIEVDSYAPKDAGKDGVRRAVVLSRWRQTQFADTFPGQQQYPRSTAQPYRVSNQSFLVPHEDFDLIARAQVTLSADSYASDAVLAVRRELDRSSPDPPLPGQHNQLSLRDYRHPFEIWSSERDFRKGRMAWIQHVGAS